MSEEKMASGAALVPGMRAPEFKLARDARPISFLKRFSRQCCVPGFLPSRFEPGLWGPDGADYQVVPEFRRLKAQLLGISVDGVWCHAAFTKDRNLHFPLLADSSRKGWWRVTMVFTGNRTVSPSVRCSLSILKGSSPGATSLPSECARVQMAFLRLSKTSHSRTGRSKMKSDFRSRFSMPVSQRDHIRGNVSARVTLVEYGSTNVPTVARRVRS
jgi:peroxiredoxin